MRGDAPGAGSGVRLAVLLFALAWTGTALGCDPDHSWKSAGEHARRQVTGRAVEALLEEALDRMQRRPAASDRIAVVLAGDESSGAAGSSSAVADFLTYFREALLARTGASFVQADAVARELKVRAGIGPALFARLERSCGATLFLKVRLAGYGSEVRTLTDTNPANPGLRTVQVFDHVTVRLSLQQPGGTYALIDELKGSCAESFLFFERVGEPASLVEAYVERPGQEPFFWTARPGKRHFVF